MRQRILFYDGGCPMCNRMVLWMLNRELKSEVFFAPLEGVTATKVLGQSYQDLIEMDTVVFSDDAKIYVRSEAAIQALFQTKYYAWLGSIMKIFPQKMRDAVYMWIATHRKRIWKSCPIIPPKFQSRFLD